MIEALWYGVVAVFTFFGVISFLCLLLLVFFKPDGSIELKIHIFNDTCTHDIHRMLYGAYVKNLIFGNLLYNGCVAVCHGLDKNKFDYVRALSAEYFVKLEIIDKLTDSGSGKETDGS